MVEVVSSVYSIYLPESHADISCCLAQKESRGLQQSATALACRSVPKALYGLHADPVPEANGQVLVSPGWPAFRLGPQPVSSSLSRSRSVASESKRPEHPFVSGSSGSFLHVPPCSGLQH